MKKKNGFTLVELLAVIIILALIMIIAIPAVLDSINKARKNSFYLYAESLQNKAMSRYTQDLEFNKENTECAVYDITKDLGLANTGDYTGEANTGDYRGWVKVERKAVNNGERTAVVNIKLEQKGDEIFSVKYCVGKGTSCTPDSPYNIGEGLKIAKVSKGLKSGEVLCVNYSHGIVNNDDSGEKKALYGGPDCIPYDRATISANSYEYKVFITLRDNNYAVSDILFNDKLKVETFYKSMNTKNLTITSPKCKASDTESSYGNEKPTKEDCKEFEVNSFDIIFETTGGTPISGHIQPTDGSNSITIPTPERKGYEFVGWYYDIEYTKPIGVTTTDKLNYTTKKDTSGCDIGVNSTKIFAKWSRNGTTEKSTGYEQVTTTEAASPDVEQITEPTTTVDITQDAILLNSLNVSGYDIGFSPIKFYYELDVPNTVESLSVSANPLISTSQVSISSADNLGVGKNALAVEVFDPNANNKAVYRINVYRYDEAGNRITTPVDGDSEWDPSSGMPDPALPESNAFLKSLLIAGYNIDFKRDVYEYTVITKGEENLLLSPLPESPKAKVNVEGNKNLKEDSVIIIKVTSQNGYYTKKYKIKIKVEIPESTFTKVIRGIAFGLGLILVVLAIAIYINKKRGVDTQKEDPNENEKQNDQSSVESNQASQKDGLPPSRL